MSELLEAHEENARANRRGWRNFFILFGIVVIALGFFIFKDDAPPDDAWMLPKFMPVGKGQNPLAAFIETIKKHPLQGTKEAPQSRDNGDKSKEPAMREFVQKNEDAIRAFDELMKTDPATWRWPGIDETFNAATKFDGLMECQSVAGQLLRMKVELLARDGMAEAAVEEALRIVRYGYGLGAAHGPLIQYLVAITVEQIGESALKSALIAPGVGEPLLRRSQEALMSFDLKTDDISYALRLEYLGLKQSIKRFINSGASSGSALGLFPDHEVFLMQYFTQTNRTLKEYLRFQKPIMHALETDWASTVNAGLMLKKEIQALESDWLRFYVTPNVGGNMILRLTLPTVNSINAKGAQNCALHRQAIIMIALRRYELEQGKLPVKLDELAPKFLDSVPADPFDNAPMRWNATDRVVYSIGKDLKDDHGAVSEPRNNKDKDTGMRYWWSAKL